MHHMEGPVVERYTSFKQRVEGDLENTRRVFGLLFSLPLFFFFPLFRDPRG